jgi:polyhydroxyalkanoate synthesis regulator protein
MQGIMGTFLEKNIMAFMEIQERMAEQSKGMYGGTQFGPETWAQFMNIQTPMLQNMMNSYIDQSKNLFVQMQDQMQDQTRSMFSAFPFNPVSSSEPKKK